MPSQPQELDDPFAADRRAIQSRDEISNGEGVVLWIPCGLAFHVTPSLPQGPQVLITSFLFLPSFLQFVILLESACT
jgi:hypothetical protein